MNALPGDGTKSERPSVILDAKPLDSMIPRNHGWGQPCHTDLEFRLKSTSLLDDVMARAKTEKNKSAGPVVFRCLDRQAEIVKTSRNLPHWFQAGSALFITFRTFDSMPKEVVRRWRAELEIWLRNNGLPIEFAARPFDQKTTQIDSVMLDQSRVTPHRFDLFPAPKQTEFKKLRDRVWHRLLDECHGKCLLKKPEFAQIVAEALLYYENEKYDLDRFVIMPNHVHLIVQFRRGVSMDVVSESWLRYTARQINYCTGAAGPFWQSEPFDHLIRSAEQFEYLQKYIADNPRKANLRDGEFLYWQR